MPSDSFKQWAQSQLPTTGRESEELIGPNTERTFNSEPPLVQKNLNILYKDNPAAFKDPSLVHAFATNNNTNPKNAAQALKYLALYNNATDGLYAKINENGVSGSVWGGVLNGLHKAWGTVANAVTGVPQALESIPGKVGGFANSYYNFWSDPNKIDNAYTKAATGTWDGTKSVWDYANNVVNRTATTGEELIGLKGIGGYKDAWNTVNNMANSTGNLVNPFSKDNGFQLMAHVIAYYESLAKQKGTAYAIGHAMPSILAMIATDGAAADSTIAGEAGSETAEMSAEAAAADQALVQYYQDVGGNVSPAELEKITQAQDRIAARNEGIAAKKEFDAEEVPNLAVETAKEFADKSLLRNTSARVFNRINPIGPMYQLARGLGSNVSSIRLNAMYILNQEAAKIENPKLWEQTQGGMVYDSNGHATDLGQQTMEWLGMHKGTLYYNMGSGIMDLYTKYLGTDPLGAAGKVWTLSHSGSSLSPRLASALHSFNQKLGNVAARATLAGNANNKITEAALHLFLKPGRVIGNMEIFFRGLGVHSAEDIELTRYAAGVADSYRFMAEHNAAEIADQFRNTYGVDTLQKLGKATTEEEVVQIHKDLADGFGLLNNKTPTLGMYSWAKTAIRDKALNIMYGNPRYPRNISDALSSDYKWVEAVDEQKLTGDYQVKNDSAIYRAENDPSLRIRATFRNWCYRQLNRKPMYWSELSKQIETERIIPGDIGAIPAIMGMARNAMMPESVVSAMGDFLMSAPDAEAFTNAYRQCLHHMIMRRAVAGLKEAELTSVSKQIEDHIWDEVNRISGFDGGSKNTAYVPGANSGNEATNYENMADIAGRTFNAGFDPTHLNVLHLPRARDLNNISDAIRNIMIEITPFQHDFFAERLTEEQVRNLAGARDLSLQTIRRHAKMVGRIRLGGEEDVVSRVELGFGKKAGNMFAGKYNYARSNIDLVLKSYQLTMNKEDAAVAAYNYLSDSYERTLKIVDEERSILDEHAFVESNPEAVNLLSRPLQPAPNIEWHVNNLADLYALHDHLASMHMGFDTTETMKNEQVREWAARKASAMRLGDVSTESQRQRYMNLLNEARNSRTGLRSGFQYVVDGCNKVLSLGFVPLALLSGKWAFHVGISELALNSFRTGGFNFFEAAVARSLAKHEFVNGGSFLVGGATRKSENILKDSADLAKTITKSLTTDTKQMFNSSTWKLGTTNLVRHSWQITRDVVAGALMGIEKSLLEAMPADERERLVENATTLLLRHPESTHPGAVHSGDDLVFDPFNHTGGVPEQTTTISPSGKEIKQNVFRTEMYGRHNKADSLGGYTNVLTENLTRANHGPVMLPIAQRLHDLLSTDYEFAGTYGSNEWKDSVVEQLQIAAKKAYMALPKSELSRLKTLDGVFDEVSISAWTQADRDAMRRQGPFYSATAGGKTNSELFKEAALEDSSKRAALGMFHLFAGRSKGKWVLHRDLIEQVVSGDIKIGFDQAQVVRKMGNAAPSNLPGLQFREADWLGNGSWKQLIQRVSEYGHDKVLGPIINYMVRDPLYILEYHRQMENIRHLVDGNVIHDFQAEVIAESRAAVNMMKFVHNPKDKTMFEENMRVLAPFYFAKNQAWRRAFRMLGEDPAAFEKYMKLCLTVTDYIGTMQNSGAIPGIHIPGSEFIGEVGNTPFTSAPAAMGFANLLFGLTGSTGSVSSMVPTGSESGVAGILGEMVRPTWGPLVTIPLKAIREYTQWGQSALYNKAMDGFLGRVASNSSIATDIMPNSFVTGMYQVLAGHMGLENGTVASITNQVMNNALDNAMTTQRAQLEKDIDWTGVSKKDKTMYLNGLTGMMISQKMTMDTEWYHNLLETSKAVAEQMLLVKTVLNFFSPLALSLNAEFSKQAGYDEIVKEKDSNGKLKYPTYAEAMNEFAVRYPTHILDLTPHTMSTQGNFPEVTQAIDLLRNHPDFIKEFGYASAMLVSRESKYSPQAYQLEMMLNLRQREAPKEYLNGLRNALGNDVYQNFIKPMVMQNSQYAYNVTDANGVTTQKLTSAGIQKLKDLSKIYGKMDNPTWFENNNPFGSIAKQSLAYQTYDQMKLMLVSPKAKNVIPTADIEKFTLLIGLYEERAKAMVAYKAGGDNTDYYAARDNWYNECANIAAMPEFANQQYFITSVLMKFPTL